MMFNSTTVVITDNGVMVNNGLCHQPGAGDNYGQQWYVSYNRIHDKADASYTMRQTGLLHFTGCDEFVGS